MTDKKNWWCADCPHESCPCPFEPKLRPCVCPAEQCPDNAPFDFPVKPCADTTE